MQVIEHRSAGTEQPKGATGTAVSEQLQFLSTAGFAVMVVLVLGALRNAAPHAPSDHSLHTLEWLALAVFVPAFVALEWVSGGNRTPTRFAELWNASRPFCAASFVVVAIAFMVLDGSSILAVVALAHGLMVYVLARGYQRPITWTLWTYGASLGAWVFSANISYTPLDKLLLNASPATALIAPVFSAALCLLLLDLASPFQRDRASAGVTVVRYVIAALFFAELAFRTDATLADWIPYHQMYWVGPATFVKEGHYLLWDVPSQYGFLSELALAFFPAGNVWQSLYVMTAIVLTVQALLLFGLMVHRRPGWLGTVVALLICSAIFFSSQASRYPFGPRLYPQGGLRFIWVIALVFLVYKIYAAKGDRERVLWRVLAWISWGISTLWAFESLAWCTFVWGGFIAVEYGIWAVSQQRTLRALAARAVAAFAPFPVIAALAFGSVNAFYSMRLGHGPDWTSYLEFSALYATDTRYHVVTETFGPGWLIVLLLGSLAVPAIYALKRRRYEMLPVLAASWLAVWASSAYYVGEPYDNHVSAVTVIFGFGYAIASLLLADLDVDSLSFTRLAFVPLFALLITTAYGEPARIAAIRAPLMPGFRFNAVDRMPTVSGELAELVHKAGIGSGDRVIFPNSPSWVKIDDGLIMPFISGPNGTKTELIGWLPQSPAGPTNTLYSLPLERRLTYVQRFLQISPHGGWYITYHSKAECSQAAADAVNVGPAIRTTNYEAVRCAIVESRMPLTVRKVLEKK